jgi:hypothetical protein
VSELRRSQVYYCLRMLFTVKLGSEVIGSSVIESGDPSMGCAYGTFVPIRAYNAIQQHCIRYREKWKPVPGLTVEEARGIALECKGGFQIVDYSPETGSEGIELHLLGITMPPYAELFPDDLKIR